MIEAPFANYHRAELERLVQEGFDRAEMLASLADRFSMPLKEFQTLVAAYVFLQTTKADCKESPLNANP